MSNPDAQCGARTKSGNPCKNPRGHHTDHPGFGRCALHGGASPSGTKAAQVQILKHEAARLGVLDEGLDPGEALMNALWSAHASLTYYRSLASELESPTHWEKGPGGALKEAPAPVVVLLHQAEQRVADIATACLRAGLEERRVRIAEREAPVIFEAVQRSLTALGVGDRMPEFRDLFTKYLAEASAPRRSLTR